jgi:hypothetical protein
MSYPGIFLLFNSRVGGEKSQTGRGHALVFGANFSRNFLKRFAL